MSDVKQFSYENISKERSEFDGKFWFTDDMVGSCRPVFDKCEHNHDVEDVLRKAGVIRKNTVTDTESCQLWVYFSTRKAGAAFIDRLKLGYGGRDLIKHDANRRMKREFKIEFQHVPTRFDAIHPVKITGLGAQGQRLGFSLEEALDLAKGLVDFLQNHTSTCMLMHAADALKAADEATKIEMNCRDAEELDHMTDYNTVMEVLPEEFTPAMKHVAQQLLYYAYMRSVGRT